MIAMDMIRVSEYANGGRFSSVHLGKFCGGILVRMQNQHGSPIHVPRVVLGVGHTQSGFLLFLGRHSYSENVWDVLIFACFEKIILIFWIKFVNVIYSVLSAQAGLAVGWIWLGRVVQLTKAGHKY